MVKRAQVKYKKAPQAPRRFKSSYMFFSTEKHKQIRKELAEKGEIEKVGGTIVLRWNSDSPLFLTDYFVATQSVNAKQLSFISPSQTDGDD